MTRIRVPLAVDAQLRIPVGPALLPLRAVVLLAAVSPVAFLSLQLGSVNVSYRIGIAITALMFAFAIALPEREGVWIGTWCAYRRVRPLLPTAVVGGTPRRAIVHAVGEGTQVMRVRAPFGILRRIPRLAHVTCIPTLTAVEPGIIRLQPGGARAVLLLEGPQGSPAGDAYATWSSRMVDWLLGVECPAQLVTVVSHHDGHRAQVAFDRSTEHAPRTPLLELERELSGAVADQSIGFRHHVVFSPGLAGTDGVPRAAGPTGAASDAAAVRVLQLAQRLAVGSGLDVSVPDRDDLGALLRQTILGASDLAADTGGVVHIGDHYQVALTATKLPPMVHSGMVVESLMRSRARGVASLHIFPVAAHVARKALDRRLALRRYTAREGNTSVDNEVAATDTAETLAALARRDLQPCRVALTLTLVGDERAQVIDSAERVLGLLTGQGFEASVATLPGLLPSIAASPGSSPLRRSLQLTSDGVAACLVPALGTPFLEMSEPLVGISELTGAPVHASVWTRANHNAIVVGSSGSGKSVTAKTLLIRHLLRGATAVVIDPDSEYRRAMNAVGGTHLELGEDALNPLAVAAAIAPDSAASLVLPVLSVMAGDEKGVRDGRPIRRLPDEDLGWLHTEVSAFFRGAAESGANEPVLSDLVGFLDTTSANRALTVREVERAWLITARLRRFTQGDHAAVFDRRSTFEVGRAPVAIGLRELSLAYASDLTPALAVILTAVLAALHRAERRLIVAVDEAHRITCDPDAGDVLGRLVRQARKYGAGVWMCSQRVEDFVGTELGRTLAATAATKVVLGVEEAAVRGVREAFALSDEEVAAINPPVTGRAVLISGHDRTLVRVLAGSAILAVAETNPRDQHPTPVATGP
ncbi:MAG: VirB4 family type IV secretion system protein [Candidatus Dormibacteria bacterium]